MPTNVRDRRNLITPEAFGIAPGLLGIPLASPVSRLGAILIDAAAIAILTAILSNVQLLLWGAIALFLLNMAFRRPERAPAAPGAAILLRIFTGCLGFMVLGTVLLVFMFIRLSTGDDPEPDGPTIAMQSMAGDRDGDPSEDQSPELDVGGLDEAEAIEEYRTLLASDDLLEDESRAARADALRLHLATLLGSDSLDTLGDELEDERQARQRAEERLAAAEEEAGLVPLFADIWDQLGSAIGLWSIYFTVLLTLGRGQTPGKRMLGIRVVRLDGEPMSWWTSFERGGGYAAGFATGLLGFAQVFWDPNRQCVHDKIVGTVVTRTGESARPLDWMEAHGLGARETRALELDPPRTD